MADSVDIKSTTKIIDLLSVGRNEEFILETLDEEAKQEALERTFQRYEEFVRQSFVNKREISDKIKVKVGSKWVKLFPEDFSNDDSIMRHDDPYNSLTKNYTNIPTVLEELYVDFYKIFKDRKIQEFEVAKDFVRRIKEAD